MQDNFNEIFFNKEIGIIEKIYDDGNFLGSNSDKLSDKEEGLVRYNCKLLFNKLQTNRYIKYKVAQEFSAELCDRGASQDITQETDVLQINNNGYILDQYVKPIIVQLKRTFDDYKSTEEFESQEKIDTFVNTVKKLLLEEARKFYQKIIEQLLEIAKKKQKEGMTTTQIASYIDIFAAGF